MPVVTAGVLAAIGGIAAGTGSYLSGSSAKSAAKSAGRAGRGPALALQRIIDSLRAGQLFGLPTRDFSGSKPEIIPYKPIELSAEAAKAIEGNTANLGSAAKLAAQTNQANTLLDAIRIESLAPGTLEGLANMGQAGKRLSAGELPFSDVLGIARNRAGLASALGLGGTQYRAALPRDLGLSRLQAIQAGGNVLSQTAATAGQINPISAQARLQQYQFSPQDQAELSFKQAVLAQQSAQQQALVDAAPDPLAALLLGEEKNRLSLYASGQLAAANAQAGLANSYLQIGNSIGSTFTDLSKLALQFQKTPTASTPAASMPAAWSNPPANTATVSFLGNRIL